MSPIRALFLDAHHTLFSEQPPRAVIYADVARRHGIERAVPAIGAAMRHAHDTLPREIDGAYRYTRPWFVQFIDAVFAALGAKATPALRDELFVRFADPATFVVHPDVVPTLTALRPRLEVIGVISNWSPALPELLAQLGLAPWFDFVIVSATERSEKPGRTLYERALARAGVCPADALHVGDHPEHDWAGARAAGLHARLLLRGVAGESPLRASPTGLPTLLTLIEHLDTLR